MNSVRKEREEKEENDTEFSNSYESGNPDAAQQTIKADMGDKL